MSTVQSFDGSAEKRSAISRRAVLGSLAAVSILPVATELRASDAHTHRLLGWPGNLPVVLVRSVEGRRLSRFRYRNAESFFRSWGERGEALSDLLYQIGIVIQLGLSAHLLDIGFVDQWCASNVGLHVDKSLTLANATGLDLHSPKLSALAAALSPYSKWRNAGPRDLPSDFAFAPQDIQALVRALLDRVLEVTGHARPAVGRR